MSTTSQIVLIGSSGAIISIGWLNTNAEGLGVIIGFLMFGLQLIFLSASIYIKFRDKRALREEVEEELKKEYISMLEMEEHSEEAIQMVWSLFSRI